MSLQQSSEIIPHGIYVAMQDSANVGLNLHRKDHIIFGSYFLLSHSSFTSVLYGHRMKHKIHPPLTVLTIKYL